MIKSLLIKADKADNCGQPEKTRLSAFLHIDFSLGGQADNLALC